MRTAAFYVTINGVDVTSRIGPVLSSLRIKLSAKSKADSCEFDLDDRGGQVFLPQTGAKIQAGIMWMGEGSVVQFEGTLDSVTHTVARGQGDILTVSAQSADRKGKLKERKHRHKDRATLGDVASAWGSEAGVQMRIESSLASIERSYWAMTGESFLAWASRVAREVGATFKVFGDTAVMVPRGSGQSASGKALATIQAARPGNIISTSLSPADNAPEYKKIRVRWYDRNEAKWKEEDVEVDARTGVQATRTTRWTGSDQADAKRRATSNKKDADRERGGGTVRLVGEPSAVPEANCIVSGIRAGIDGTYRIDAVDHEFSRSGFTTNLTLKQPQAAAETGAATPGSDTQAETSDGSSDAPLPPERDDESEGSST